MSATIAGEMRSIALPLQVRKPAPRAAFSALFREVSAEIAGFIGSRRDPWGFARTGVGRSGVAGLNADGAAQRARLHAATEARGSVDTTESTAPAASQGVEPARQRAFVAAIAPLVEEVGERLGISPQLIAAHAALESGWGQRPLRNPDGSDTHNLFGVKTGESWKGEGTKATTTEFENGVAVRKAQEFRSYVDLASAFRDYARLLGESPRYRAVLNVGDDARAFARGLMLGRYATDPDYADKLERIAGQLRAMGLQAMGTALTGGR